MTQQVSTAYKKVMIRWLLKRYKMKRKECVWILNYLLSNEKLLDNVHFTEEAHYCPRAMIMSVVETDQIPFRFYRGNLMTADAEKAFHELRMNPDEAMYIQINIPKDVYASTYYQALVENPYIPEYSKVNKKDKEMADSFLGEMSSSMAENAYSLLIDKALDERDEKEFLRLVQERDKVRSGELQKLF